MRLTIATIGLAILLIGCTAEDEQAAKQQIEQDSEQVAADTEKKAMHVAGNARDNVKHAGMKIREWLVGKPEAGKQAVPSSYCYRVLQDIVCYRQPMPGWEHRLIAYQGTGAELPPPAVTIPLPSRALDESMLPANRLVNADPVFVEIPAEIKEEKAEGKGETAQPVATDAAHEALPDPALAPQL